MKVNDFIRDVINHFNSMAVLTESEESLLQRGIDLVKTYTVVLIDENGEVDRTNVDEKSDELAWDLFKDFAPDKGYRITDSMYLLWEEKDENGV